MKKARFCALCLATCLFLLPACALAGAAWLAPEGIVEDFQAYSGIQGSRAYVLCDKLTVRSAPSWNADAVTRLRGGNTFVTWENENGWLNCYYSDGAEIGWVRSEYVLIDPAFVQMESSTPAYAYDGYDSPRVGLIGTGEKLPIILETDAGCWVSLRSGSAFIRDVRYPAPASALEITYAVLTVNATDTMAALGKPSIDHAALTDPNKLRTLSDLLDGAEQLGYATGCPFGIATLTVYCADGSVYTLDLATDDCTIYILNGVYYNYMPAEYRNQDEHPDNSILFDLFQDEANG